VTRSNKNQSVDLPERSEHILKLLIEKYIENGQPVGSKIIAGNTDLSLSSATVRNVLADLENRGYLKSPHTSAGRVPTTEGYRLFVDHLLTVSDLGAAENHISQVKHIKQLLSANTDSQSIAETASRMLSDMTQLTGIVLVPSSQNKTLRHMEFLPLNSKQVLVILVINEKEVQNYVIDTDREFDEIELNQATNYVNQNFSGQSVAAIREQLLHLMKQEKQDLTGLMETAISVSSKALEKTKSQDSLVIQGESNLLGSQNADLGRLKGLFNAFNQKRDIIDILDRCSQSKGMQIFIGKESGNQLFDDMSLISAPYTLGEEVVGVLAVVGPTRIPYQKVIPTVNITAKILASVLNQTH
jgi:heat-inducible transcriptional repressor